MKRRQFLDSAGISVLCALAGTGCTITRFAGNRGSPVAAQDTRAGYLARMLDELCPDLKPRPAGSEAYNAAATIVLREMRNALPVAWLDTFTFEYWNLLNEPSLFIGDRRIESYLAIGSLGTPRGGLEGVAVETNDKRIQYKLIDAAGTEMANIAVYQGKAISRSCGPFGREQKCPPLFIIGEQDEPLLREAAANRIPVRMNAQVEFVPDTPTSNVIGTIPGKSSEEIIFMAHLDTVRAGPGANDNTASLILVLMLAYAVAGTRPKKTLTFVASSCEEIGQHGSRHYFGRRKKDGTLDRTSCSFNFDSVTWGPDLIIQTTDDRIREDFQRIGDDVSFPGTVKAVNGDGTIIDNIPLRDTTVRCVYVGSEGSDVMKVWHRPDDIPANVRVDYVEYTYRIFYEYLTRNIL